MKQVKRIPITQEGFEKLNKDLEDLKSSRPQAVKTLADARAMGDLSENGLYTAAKARLRSIDNQIFRLDIQIKLADIKEKSISGVVEIGSTVKVTDGTQFKNFYIVGDYEANPQEGKISQNSPLGKALMGKMVGEIVVFNAPIGETEFQIVRIS